MPESEPMECHRKCPFHTPPFKLGRRGTSQRRIQAHCHVLFCKDIVEKITYTGPIEPIPTHVGKRCMFQKAISVQYQQAQQYQPAYQQAQV